MKNVKCVFIVIGKCIFVLLFVYHCYFLFYLFLTGRCTLNNITVQLFPGQMLDEPPIVT